MRVSVASSTQRICRSAAALDDLDPLVGKTAEIDRQAQAGSPLATAAASPLWLGGERWGRDVAANWCRAPGCRS
jgi:hypothetical protein